MCFNTAAEKGTFFPSILGWGDGQPEYLLGRISILQSDLLCEEHMLFAK